MVIAHHAPAVDVFLSYLCTYNAMLLHLLVVCKLDVVVLVCICIDCQACLCVCTYACQDR